MGKYRRLAIIISALLPLILTLILVLLVVHSIDIRDYLLPCGSCEARGLLCCIHLTPAGFLAGFMNAVALYGILITLPSLALSLILYGLGRIFMKKNELLQTITLSLFSFGISGLAIIASSSFVKSLLP